MHNKFIQAISFFRHDDRKLRDDRWIFTSMLVGAILSLIASLALSIDAVELAANPDAVLGCSISAIVNCATVNTHPSAFMLGFPNSFLGLISEPVVITVAIAGLAGIKFPRRFMFTAQIFYTLGFLFALLLFGISFFVIGALCPWCLLVTATTMFVWFAITRYNIREGNLYLSKKASKWAKGVVAKDYDKVVLFSLLALIIVMIIVKYGRDLFS